VVRTRRRLATTAKPGSSYARKELWTVRCEGDGGGHGHAVVECLQEVCDAAGRVGEGEHGTAVDGGCGVGGGDEVAEDAGVAGEEALVDEEVVAAGAEGDVAVAKGEVGVSDEGHEQVRVGTFFKFLSFCAMADIAAALRLVPGAPPPIALSKSQRKKRKTGTKSRTPGSPADGSVTLPDAPSADGPPDEDLKADNVAPEPAAASEAPTHDDLGPKSSPVVELLQKRMRTLNKKIVCPFVFSPCAVNSADLDSPGSKAT
jgi:hypothetical protein